MIHYHGTPITPVEAAIRLLRGRHAFVSYAAPESLPIAMDYCQSFALDNGAFSVWRQGKMPDWKGYYEWVADVSRHPGFDFAVIPDVIDGSEEENDDLISAWPLGCKGVPVWHFHECLDRLRRLATDWPRIALGSSGEFSSPGTQGWWLRMQQVMDVVCDAAGFPVTKLHGLRMLNPEIFKLVPFASCDSTNCAQNMGIAWRGRYEPATKATKAIVIAERIELAEFAGRWNGWRQDRLFA